MPNPSAPTEEPESDTLVEGDYDVMDPRVRQRFSGGDFEKTPKFSGTPDEDQLREFNEKLPPKASPAQKLGQGFKQAFAFAKTSGWRLRIRHYIDRKYWRCLSYQGYCPMCVSEVLDKRQRASSDAYLGNVIYFQTDVLGQFLFGENDEVLWRPAYAILGGKKMARIRDVLSLYEGNPAGVAIESTLENPSFSDFVVQAFPDRSKAARLIKAQMCVELENGALSWSEEVLDRVEQEGLPQEVWEKFLSADITAADAIKQFKLSDQDEKLKELTKTSPRVADSSKGKAKPTDRGVARSRLAAPPPDLDSREPALPADEDEPGPVDPDEVLPAATAKRASGIAKAPPAEEKTVDKKATPGVLDEL
ncbi:hypothetical protein KW797_03285 [Candidatus Parcubacteria bacterium]|nr:hypothetical protein [Candidatus Parcubacteria bacterium]